MLLLILVIAAIVFGVVGLFTVAKWLLIIAGVLLVLAVVSAIIDRDRRAKL